jgi:hypothetical protein
LNSKILKTDALSIKAVMETISNHQYKEGDVTGEYVFCYEQTGKQEKIIFFF